MTERNMLIIKTSWSQIIAQPDKPGVQFYEKLFDLAPCLRTMFQPNLEHQIAKFTDMITHMVTHLQNSDSNESELTALAKRHVGYGTKPEHYALVGDALLFTLKNSLGDSWDHETATAWTDLYKFWTTRMIRAAHIST